MKPTVLIGVLACLVGSGAKATEPPEQLQAAQSKEKTGETPEAAAPLLKPGYTWVYSVETPKEKHIFTWTVTSEETVDSVPYYVVNYARGKDFYLRKEDLALGMTKVYGQIETRIVPPSLHYVWPLVSGKQWDNTFTETRLRENTTQEKAASCKATVEETTVSAGTFNAFRVTCRDRRNDELVSERWYSPEVKNVVRDVRPTPDGTRVTELLGFKVDDVLPAPINLKNPPSDCHDIHPPVAVYKRDPSYPAELRRLGAKGVVIVEAVIGTDGVPTDLTVLKEANARLTALAVEAVREWRYKPAFCYGGRPVRVYLTVTVTFSLH